VGGVDGSDARVSVGVGIGAGAERPVPPQGLRLPVVVVVGETVHEGVVYWALDPFVPLQFPALFAQLLGLFHGLTTLLPLTPLSLSLAPDFSLMVLLPRRPVARPVAATARRHGVFAVTTSSRGRGLGLSR